jgi:anti-sigma-K factor RskA
LALHAGGDLGRIARWRMERHLRQCESCQDEILAFQEVRRMVADLSAMPEMPWSRLSAEMHANIRLGLSAGECVRESPEPESAWKRLGGFRIAMATVSMALVVCAGLLLEKPTLNPIVKGDNQVVLRATKDGVQVSMGNELVDLKHDAVQNVSYSASTKGSMEGMSVDKLTGDVMVTGVSW